MGLRLVMHVPSRPIGCVWAGHFAWQIWGGNFKKGQIFLHHAVLYLVHPSFVWVVSRELLACYCLSNEASPNYGQNTTNTSNLKSWPYRHYIVFVGVFISPCRVSHLVANLGWVELNLRSSLGRLVNTVGSYCPGKMVEHSKPMSAKPSPRPDGTPCMSF